MAKKKETKQELLNIQFQSPEWEYRLGQHGYPFYKTFLYQKLERAYRVFINKFPFPATFEIKHTPIRTLPAGGQLVSFWIIVEVVVFTTSTKLVNEHPKISQGVNFNATRFQYEFDKVWKRYSTYLAEYKGRAGRNAV